MAKEKFKNDGPKYTEWELKDRYVETVVPSHGDMSGTDRWIQKKAAYTTEGVWQSFTALRDSFKGLLVDANGFVHSDEAHKMAQLMMDSYLLRRSRGLGASIPKQVVPINAAPGESGIDLIESEHFPDKKGVSENEKLRWIFENLRVDGLTPSDAPSIGTWALLLEMRGNEDMRRDFYKTLWPKLLTKEDADKGGKLNDSGKDTIELIERLQKALEEK